MQEDNEDNNKEEEEVKPEDEEEELEEGQAPKFKPEGKYWTSYDGRPRNYVQVLRRYNKYPLAEMTVTYDKLEETVYNSISSIINEKTNIIDLIYVKK